MGANSKLFWVLAGYFALLTVVYTVWSLFFNAQPLATTASITGGGIEWVGTVGLALSAIASTLIAFYIGRTRKAQGGELPEDRIDAEIDDGQAEQGFFSPWSWWPVMLAGSLAVVFLGLAIGPWLVFYGVPLVLIAISGWVYEYYRGLFAH
ncbi:cytochrome c oxidase subunit 4 [Conyzicola nivalis]|uniref:cytochrome-c oxidase n=1 Tax=Conyzicola nivalis TaxID=1477021 RepID=A0A916SM16_9MICO|nr:cytochrome c oxidase subunit 4 [Conyzicola nivalis]GGB04167.1 cytochrome c oxidase polypeptide 4 [Conyzicola nivalis]